MLGDGLRLGRREADRAGGNIYINASDFAEIACPHMLRTEQQEHRGDRDALLRKTQTPAARPPENRGRAHGMSPRIILCTRVVSRNWGSNEPSDTASPRRRDGGSVGNSGT